MADFKFSIFNLYFVSNLFIFELLSHCSLVYISKILKNEKTTISFETGKSQIVYLYSCTEHFPRRAVYASLIHSHVQ